MAERYTHSINTRLLSSYFSNVLSQHINSTMKLSTVFSTLCAVASSASVAAAFQISSTRNPLKAPTTSSSTALSAVAAASDESNDDRRAFLGKTMALSTAALVNGWAWTNAALPAFAEDAAATAVDYKAVAADIAAMVKADPDKGPTLVRLAWHSSGTYDKMTKTGGSGGGTIRFAEELAHGGNAGLASTAVAWMDPIYKKYASQGLSYADLYTLGGGTVVLSWSRLEAYACFN
jgi:cytochrome c peroxidase